MKATWNDTVLAESEATKNVDGNHYFPADSVNQTLLKPSSATTSCGWKGLCNYYDIVVDGKVNEQAAWYYADPKPQAANIKGYIAFWKGVKVQ